jgi:L-iditol 2-dehydrogenase
MKFKGWTIEGPSYVELHEFDTEVGGGLVKTDSPEFATAPKTPLADDGAIIKQMVSSICGSDKWLFPMGGDIRRPKGCQFGHEMVSEIIALGKEVKDLKLGQRVYPFPLYVKESTKFAGRPGAYSELTVVDHAKLNHNLYALPDSVSDKAASMIEPTTVGFRSAEGLHAALGKKAVVLGPGPIGLAAAINLREKGVEDIVIIGRSRKRLEIAEGVDIIKPFETLSTLDDDWRDKLFERFGETMTQTGKAVDVDIWIDAASDAKLLQDVYNMSKLFAFISVVGVHHEEVSFDLRKLTWSGVTLVGSAGYRPDDVPNVIKAMASGRYDFDSIVTATFPFDKVDEALEFVQDGARALKVQIDYRL